MNSEPGRISMGEMAHVSRRPPGLGYLQASPLPQVLHSLNSLKGGYIGDYLGDSLKEDSIGDSI